MADAEAAPSSAVARTLNRIVVGISGASGAIYGVRLLQALQGQPGVEAHAVVSDAGWRTLQHECGVDGPAALQALAPGHQLHDVRNVGATLASGSFRSHAMVVAPCSMRTLAAIAHGLSDNLLTRAADVMLKERRKLVLMVRETPLHLVHLRNMLTVTEMGAICCPPLPAFYQHPRSVQDVVDASVARVLDLIDVPHTLAPRLPVGRWLGVHQPRRTGAKSAQLRSARELLHRPAHVPGRQRRLHRPLRRCGGAQRGHGH